MNCLDNYIGVRGCEDSSPESGRYINDRPGVSLYLAGRIVDGEDGSGTELLQKAVREGYYTAMSDLISELAARGYYLEQDRAIYGRNNAPTSKVLKAGATHSTTITRCTQYETVSIDRMEFATKEEGEVRVKLIAANQEHSFAKIISLHGTIEISRDIESPTKIEIESDVDLYYWGECDCSCVGSGIHPAAFIVNSHFDLCRLGYNYRRVMTEAFLDAATIAFMLEARVSPRLNQAARASRDTAEVVLAELRGGRNPETGEYLKGSYKKAIEKAAHSLTADIDEKRIPCFRVSAPKVVWNL